MRHKRHVCPVCGGTMRHEGKGDPQHDGHHPTEFYCPECEKTRLRG